MRNLTHLRTVAYISTKELQKINIKYYFFTFIFRSLLLPTLLIQRKKKNTLDSSVNVFCLEKCLYEAHQGTGVQAAHITLPFV